MLIFGVIFPGLSISAVITVVMHNYYKTIGQNIVFFKRSVVILVMSAIGNYIAFAIFKSPLAMSISSMVTMVIWYIISDLHLSKWAQTKSYTNIGYLLMISFSFYACITLKNSYVGLFAYLMSFTVLTTAFYLKTFGLIKTLLIKK